MATKIRLQRHGKKGKPYFHIVAADSRAKRDGRYIERIGNYNPNTNPATIELDFDRAVYWLQVGAQPTDTAKAILSYKGAIYKNHLLKGIAKGALTEDQVNKKFDAWLSEKEGKVQTQLDSIKSAGEKVKADVFAAEKAINEERANLIAAAQSALAADAAAATEAAAAAIAAEKAAPAAPAVAEEVATPVDEAAPAVVEEVAAPVEEAVAEAPAAVEEVAAPVEEAVAEDPTAVEEVAAPAEEVVAEAPAAVEEVAAPAEEVVTEAPAAEEKAEDSSKEEKA
jgi:small subunit ribosomal protein S16